MEQDTMSDELLLSADSHVIEDPQLWKKRLPQSFQDRAPAFPELKVGGAFQAQPGGHDPRARLSEMAQDGVSGEVLYPSFCLDLYGLTDAALQEACFRAYNDWIIEYCSAAPDRLFGIGNLACFDISSAVKELERCKRSGLRGAMIWQVPPSDLPFHGDHYERLWAAAQELDMPISLHILTGIAYPFPRQPPNRVAHVYLPHAVNDKLLYASNAICGLIAGGVLERFPGLKLVLVENEVSWLPFVLSQYDKYWSRGNLQSQMKRNPGEYFERQIYATFFNDPPSRMLLGNWGTKNFMWSNDYPHPNSTWPKSREVIDRDLGHLPADARKRLLSRNVQELYKLPQIAELPQAVH
jgi:predicted TIM-barrel fold metal-dependent hydrolase